MIGKVMRGSHVGGLLRYLFGPGRANEHTDPHLVASWDGHPGALAPPLTPQGRHDVRELARLLEQPLAVAVRAPDRPVWHCAVRVAPGDRQLSDYEWCDVARDIVSRTGLAPDGDDGACRWVAVRHADDHIHLVVTLARQDGGAARTSNDYYRVGEACRAAEARLGLTTTAPRDRTAPRRATRAETEKAARAGRSEPARLTLTSEVRAAAAGAATPQEFLARLRDAGLLVRPRYSITEPDVVTGYAVALPDDRTTAPAGEAGHDGGVVWFGGGKLAADLTWPRLSARWDAAPDGAPGATSDAAADATPGTTVPQLSPDASRDAGARSPRTPDADIDPLRPSWVPTPAAAPTRSDAPRRYRLTGAARAEAWRHAANLTASAAAEVTRLAATDPAAASDLAHATGRVLTATARAVEGRSRGPLTAAADTFDRAARDVHARSPRRMHTGDNLRAVARLVALTGRAGKDETAQVMALVANLAALAAAVADLRDAQRRGAQAAAARAASDGFGSVAAASSATSPAAAPAPGLVHSPRPDPVIHRTGPRHGTATTTRRRVNP